MTHADFVHLRVHSAYSLAEGAIKVEDLIRLCTAQAMPAVAITDSNNLFGAMEFATTAAKNGLQPIIGLTLNLMVPEDQIETRSRSAAPPDPDQIVLLAQTEPGYRCLMALSSRAFLETEDSDVPRISWRQLDETLQEIFPGGNDGVICLSGGVGGPVGRLLQAGHPKKARKALQDLAQRFPNRLYVELQRHGLPAQERLEPAFLDLAYELDLPLVATNHVFFPDEALYEAHDALLCIAGSTYVDEAERRRVTPDHRFKTAAEMRTLFADLPEAVDNTLVIARRCAYMPRKVKPMLPAYPVGEGRTEAEELAVQARAGLDLRLEKQVFTPEMDAAEREALRKTYEDRLTHELSIIEGMGFPGYFLIVADFIHWTKEQGIPVGPGRGSGAGSVVAWALTITDLDPLRFQLLFERFLNPERVSMPDFDIDFCQERRDEVIHYVQDRYGRDRVAHIITFGKLQARAALRDVGRVLQLPYGQVDRLCKLVPNNPAKPVKLKEAVEEEPRLQEERDKDDHVRRMIEIAVQLEGLYRNASTHAAGVVIGDRPLVEMVPLYQDPKAHMPATQFNMIWVEESGLVKFDFLGLKTLTVLSKAVHFIEGSRQRGWEDGPGVDLSALPFDDAPTFALLSRADTVGVFQLESTGMRDVLRRLKPDRIEDLIAVVALYRPGPMDNIPSYIDRKHGKEEPDYLYPSLESVLKETYGIIIYQEQVMQIAQILAGYSLGGADLLRRAMGKKKQEEMDKQRAIFLEGAVEKGVKRETANSIFDLVAKFAGYGFNKSHAAAYALVAYQTAYVKANYPVEFMAASMALDLNNTDKLAVFRSELKRQGIPLLPPDINQSLVNFSVDRQEDGTRAVRYALAAVKNVGEAAMASLVAERERGGPFKSLADFTTRLDPKMINKRLVENLACAGAFDSLEPNRRKVYEAAETLLKRAAAKAEERASNQINLFAGSEDSEERLDLPQVKDWVPVERLSYEAQAIGFYLSAHPLDAFRESLRRLDAVSILDLPQRFKERASSRVKMAGIVHGKKERTSSKGKRFAFVELSDASGSYEVTVFSEVLGVCRELLESGAPLLLEVSVRQESDEEESLRLTLNGVERLDEAAERTAAGLEIILQEEAALASLKACLDPLAPGRGQIKLVLDLGQSAAVDAISQVVVDLGNTFSVGAELRRQVMDIPGVLDVHDL